MDGSKWSKWIQPKEEDNRTQLQSIEIQDKKKNNERQLRNEENKKKMKLSLKVCSTKAHDTTWVHLHAYNPPLPLHFLHTSASLKVS